jgi:hypothetical protein
MIYCKSINGLITLLRVHLAWKCGLVNEDNGLRPSGDVNTINLSSHFILPPATILSHSSKTIIIIIARAIVPLIRFLFFNVSIFHEGRNLSNSPQTRTDNSNYLRFGSLQLEGYEIEQHQTWTDKSLAKTTRNQLLLLFRKNVYQLTVSQHSFYLFNLSTSLERAVKWK